jgi:hypothetical protein
MENVMEKNSMLSDEYISDKIYLMRGQKVMLDSDLSHMYDMKAIRLRQQVRRNLERFPSHFMFQFTMEEVELMVSQNVIPSKSHFGGALPYMFTEHGVLMLANVVKSQRAIAMCIKIIEVFVKLRELMMGQKDMLLRFEQLEKLLVQHDSDIQALFNAWKQLIHQKNEPRPTIGFKLKNT